MTESGSSRKNLPFAVAWLCVGLSVICGAWLVPVHLKAISAAVLGRAGQGTPSVARFGEQLLDSEKLGPAQLVLQAAQQVSDPETARVEQGIQQMETRRPEWVAWGGWDPFLDPLFFFFNDTAPTESTPVLNFFITE